MLWFGLIAFVAVALLISAEVILDRELRWSDLSLDGLAFALMWLAWVFDRITWRPQKNLDGFLKDGRV